MMLLHALLLPLVAAALLRPSGVRYNGSTCPTTGPHGCTNWTIAAGISAVGPEAVHLPVRRLSRRSAPLPVLLLIAGVEPNPGPTALRCGLLNVRGATSKAALIHDLIDSQQLDLLLLTETNIAHDAPAAIRDDVAPVGFKCLHAPRVGRKKIKGCGIAVVFRSHIKVERITPSVHPASFEQLCFKVTSASRRVNRVVIYRPTTACKLDFL